jgi:subtilisin family serine protease
MAAPQVSGVAALMLSANPGLSPSAVRALLMASAAGRGVPGTASGEVWAPRALELTDAQGGVASGAGPGAPGRAGGTDASGGGTRTAGVGSLRIVVASPPRRVARNGRVTLRWTVTGDASQVRRIRVDVDGRRRATLGPGARRVTLRLRPGRHRVVVRAVGAGGRSLARSPARRFLLAARR